MLLHVDAVSVQLYIVKRPAADVLFPSQPPFLLLSARLLNNFRLQSPTFHYKNSRTVARQGNSSCAG